MRIKGNTKRARRRKRKFGDPIGYTIKFEHGASFAAGATMMEICTPIYKNRREEQSGRAREANEYVKAMEEMMASMPEYLTPDGSPNLQDAHPVFDPDAIARLESAVTLLRGGNHIIWSGQSFYSGNPDYIPAHPAKPGEERGG